MDSQAKYDAVVENTKREMEEKQTTGNTPSNYVENAKAVGINVDYNEKGEPVRYYVKNGNNVYSTDGYVTVTVDSDVVLTKDPTSTDDNIIINYNISGANTTEKGDAVNAGSTLIYTDREQFIKSVLNATGLDVEMTELDADTYNRIWEATQDYSTLTYGNNIENFVHTYMKSLPTGALPNDKLELFTSDAPMLAVIKMAKRLGLYDAETYIDEDPIFKAQMRQTNVGDFIGLMPFENHLDYDNPDLQYANFTRNILLRLAYDTAHMSSAHLPLPSNLNDYRMDNETVFRFINNIANDVYNKNVNMWITSTWDSYEYGKDVQFKTVGLIAGQDNQVQVLQNYPDYGFAVVGTSHWTGLITVGPRYGGSNDTFVMKDWTGTAFADGTLVDRAPMTFMIVYDINSFTNYVISNEFDTRNHKLPIINCNGTVRQNYKAGVNVRNDALRLPDNPSDTDIHSAIEVQYPDWYDNSYTETHYDPVTNNNVTNRYYTINTGDDGDPRTGTPDIWEIIKNIGDRIIPNEEDDEKDADNDISPTASNEFYTVYKPSDTAMGQLGHFLWEQSAIDLLRQVFQNPTDGVISFHHLYLDPHVDGKNYECMMGTVNTHVGMPKVTELKTTLDFGECIVPRWFEDARDYTETSVQLYIPFIGFRELSPLDVIGYKIKLKVICDVMTGVFVAEVRVVKGNQFGNNIESLMYTFEGCCAIQIPITSADKARMWANAIGGGISGAVNGATTGARLGKTAGAIAGGVIGTIGGGIGGAVSTGIGISRTSEFSSNGGALNTYKRPFVLISRSVPADADKYNELYGFPANKTVKLGNMKGFTKIKDIHLEIPRATDTERQMLYDQLVNGVIF